MLFPIKVVDIELSEPIPTFAGLEGYIGLWGLLRLHREPLGYVEAPITAGICTAADLSRLILEQHGQTLSERLLRSAVASPHWPQLVQSEGVKFDALLNIPPAKYPATDNDALPLVTVAVCTRDRPEDMRLCLEAISQLDYPHLDILVVDNAPQTDGTRSLVETHYPQVRYVQEPRPGLDWARNRAILAAKGDIIAYTDDDVVVDAGWVTNLVQVFASHPEAMAVTGLVVPYELETESQVLFEAYGGFGKGFERKQYQVPEGQTIPWWMCGAGQFGTGANMAYRRAVFSQIGFFDPGLDVGTVTNGGGDLEMFFRVLQEGHTLIYEPNAVVRHRHRRSYAKLKTQLTNNGIGLYAYLVRSAQAYPKALGSILWVGIYWFIDWNVRRAWIAFKHPTRIPAELVWSELRGSWAGLWRYPQACRKVRQIEQEFGSQVADIEQFNRLQQPIWDGHQTQLQSQSRLDKADEAIASHRSADNPRKADSIAVRQLRLEDRLQPIDDIAAYPVVRVFVTWRSALLGHFDIANQFASVQPRALIEQLLEHFDGAMIGQLLNLSADADPYQAALEDLERHYGVTQEAIAPVLPDDVKVTINLATFDRPDDLRNCLQRLHEQQTNREVEIVVVDNHPASGLTPPVVAEFPGVKLVRESRQGLAYARNTGFAASTGAVIIATDDDVTVPPDWLEKLVAPFAKAHVGVVTGNVLPIQLETPSQQFFEQYGGLGKGYESLEVGLDWFESSPRYAMQTWRLGATANAAFRAAILAHPQVGLMDESLGPGMPSGVGEDTYLFYKAIKAGYSLVYESSAFVWHRHRQDPGALRRQLYGYSKGHVSYNLTPWLRDGDWRGLYQIFVGLSIYHAYRIVKWILRRDTYPISLIMLEIWGNFAGPWSLWQSRRRVRREGHSSPYVRPEARSPSLASLETAVPSASGPCSTLVADSEATSNV